MTNARILFLCPSMAYCINLGENCDTGLSTDSVGPVVWRLFFPIPYLVHAVNIVSLPAERSVVAWPRGPSFRAACAVRFVLALR